MRIYLTGFMGAGKSTIGRLLAAQLSVAFIDLDKEIEHHLSSTIAEAFERQGEYYFRDQERAVLESITRDSVVIATGGGCFLHNRDFMLGNGTVIFLDVPFLQIVQRIGGDPERPLWKNAERLFHERTSEYKKAHITVDASADPDTVVQRIKNLLLQAQKKTPEN